MSSASLVGPVDEDDRLVFWGSALVVAGVILSAASVALAARYTHERNHSTGKGSGVGLASLLTLVVLGFVAALIVGHCVDARRTCAHLEAFIGQGPRSP